MWIRRVRCHVCGGPKVTPSRTAYDYCSWCGTFVDWNHQVAYDTRGSQQPGPQYDALKVYLMPQIDAARRRGDRAAVEQAYRRLYAQHVADCPAAYSPRVGDETYRERIIAFHAASDALRLLDLASTALESEVERVSRTMFWMHTPEGQVVRPDRFFAVYNAFLPLQKRIDGVLRDAGVAAHHPDRAPEALLHKIAISAFVQNWIPRLDKATVQAALTMTGLAAQYEEMVAPSLDRRACAECGNRFDVAHGAQCVMCETCGTMLDARAHDVRCGQCGADVTPPQGERQFACPYCKCVLEIVRR